MFTRSLNSLLLAACVGLTGLLAQAQTNASCTFHVFTIPVSSGTPIAQSINKFGTIVGFVNQFQAHSAGFIRFSNGAVSIFQAPNSGDTFIRHRNDQGLDTGSFRLAGTNTNKGFAAAGSRFQTINFPGASQTFVTASNNFGVIVGNYIGPDNHFHGFMLKSGKFTTIHPNGAVDTVVNGVNDSGVIVGNFFTGGSDSQGFVDRNGAISTLSFPGEVGFGGTTLNDISNTGEIVGFVWTGPDTRSAFIHNSGGFKVVSVPHSRLTEANGISNSNVIAGHTIIVGTNTETDEAFTATCH